MKRAYIFAALLGIAIMPSVAGSVRRTHTLFGLPENRPYVVFVDGEARGGTHTWYQSLRFETEGPAAIAVVDAADTVVSGIGREPARFRPERRIPEGAALYDVSGARVRPRLRGLDEMPSGVYFWRLGRRTGKVVIVK